jgi:hypothetical protein
VRLKKILKVSALILALGAFFGMVVVDVVAAPAASAAQSAPASSSAAPVITPSTTFGALPQVAPIVYAAPAPIIIPDPETQTREFILKVIDTVEHRQWLMLLPFAMVALVYALRTYGAKKWAFLATPRGGALLGLLGALASAFALALVSGATGAKGIAAATIAALVVQYPIFKTLKNLVAPDGAQAASQIAAEANIAADQAKAAAEKSAEAAAAEMAKVGVQPPPAV